MYRNLLRLILSSLACIQPSRTFVIHFQTTPSLTTHHHLSNTVSPLKDSPKLGIDLSLEPLNKTEYESLKAACIVAIDKTTERGLNDLHALRNKWQEDILIKSPILERKMVLNGIQEAKLLEIRMDRIIGNFLNQSFDERTLTRRMLQDDQQRREDAERVALEPKKSNIEPWGKTNKEYDDWDDWWD